MMWLNIIHKHRGMGDTIDEIARASGVKWAVEEFEKRTGRDCGCKRRKEKLNKLFPYQKEGL